MLLQAAFSGSVISEILLVLAILVVLFVIFRLGKFLLGILANSILGLISIFVINAIFGIGIPINLLTVVATALFGLPAVFIMVILRLLGFAL